MSSEASTTIMLNELEWFVGSLESLIAVLTSGSPALAVSELARLEAEFATIEAAVVAARVRVDAL